MFSTATPLPGKPTILHLGLFGHFKCVIYLDAEVPDCAFQPSLTARRFFVRRLRRTKASLICVSTVTTLRTCRRDKRLGWFIGESCRPSATRRNCRSGCAGWYDLTQLQVRDVCHGEPIASRATIRQQKTQRPMQVEITEQTRDSVAAWIR
jgi:hypothetical protein